MAHTRAQERRAKGVLFYRILIKRGLCLLISSPFNVLLEKEAITAKEKLQGKLLLNRPLAIHFANEVWGSYLTVSNFI